MWFVPVGEAWREAATEVAELSAPRREHVTVGRQQFEVILEPDLEVGGWVVECPALPGCVSEGNSLPEARRMVREAIRGWQEVASQPMATGVRRRRARS